MAQGKSIKDVQKLAKGLRAAAAASRRILPAPGAGPAPQAPAQTAIAYRRMGL